MHIEDIQSRSERHNWEIGAHTHRGLYQVVAIEAGHPDGWWKYLGGHGAVVGIECFGESAPAHELYAFFRINVARIVAEARRLVAGEGP